MCTLAPRTWTVCLDIYLLLQGNGFFAKSRFTPVKKTRKFLFSWLSLPLCAQWHRGHGLCKGLTEVVCWGRAKQWAIPSHPQRCNWSTTHDRKGYLEWNVWRETKVTQLSRASIWGESQRWHGAFLICIPNSKPNPSEGTRNILPDKRHEFLASSLWSFQRLTSRPGQNDLQSQECCCYFSEKYLQEKSPETSRCWIESWKWFFFFFKLKNIFVFTSLKSGRGSGRPSGPSREVQSHVCFGKVGRGGISTPAGFKGRVTWGGF